MPTRGSAWSRIEVEATVASYFNMLELGLTGRAFSKTEHRRALLPLLNNRSEGAVERKHQNISAILIEERVPYITGYKPLGNYQGMLREVVVEQLGARARTRAIIEAEVERVPALPTLDNLLDTLTPVPMARPGMDGPPRPRRRGAARAPADYLLLEARNRQLGLAGEQFVVNLERARLELAGASRLAAQVRHVSVERGDGLGYDVLSYDEDSRERLIEVKTTKFGEYTPFYVSVNEVEVSREERERYHLYRVHSFGPKPRLFTLEGALDEVVSLKPSSFVARLN